MFERHQYESREEWLKSRGKGIGGSDSACILGLNNYKSNLRLWQEKMGLVEVEDISDKEEVKYGLLAEEQIREVFKLDYEDYLEVYHKPNENLVRVDKPYLRCSLDGEIEVKQDLEVRSYWDGERDEIVPNMVELKKGMNGIFEVKTTKIRNQRQWGEWKKGIPNNYFCQCLHNLLVSGYDFAWLRVQIKSTNQIGVTTLQVRDYCCLRDSVIGQLEYLEAEEDKFWIENMVGKKEPALKIRF